ncbi:MULTISPECIES: efflux RND transporter permease subunit [unclassified Aureimonas]|uniref:efflux RND transporter permease subunit n=1 Tax=unclassified Aureimonas TaxID=2615206 RepID=UPI0006F51F44|nr:MULTISPECIES: efflux RND transporter permease subunit [unclassified Aureimonas]KQT52788.1 RND transporter [Aureimonas sp. Leaf427]KQT80247.1 RND transporter [Aureimonas sp. Leaf460]
MNARFFVDRPVFASVISIVIFLAGIMGMRALPIEQYPELVPPEVVVSAAYPGASAETLAQTVSAPLEEQINGVEDMIYMKSTNSSSGTASVTVTFASGTDPDQATINVNNRVQQAVSSLPTEVQRLGVTVTKRSSSILAVLTMTSADPRYDATYVSNYALLYVLDELKRSSGIGDAQLFGQRDYSMRIWLRPDQLAQYNLTPTDVATAIREQNAQFAAGQFGAEPNPNELAFTYSVTTGGRLPDAQAFENIILRSNANAASLLLKDVARVELGAQDYAFNATYNGASTVPIGIYLQPGANALETLEGVRARMDELQASFPDGISYAIPYDTTKFITASIEEVIKTFIEAMVLVFVVVFVFLQNFRATLIPMIAVPVSIIGTFGMLLVLGFSINLLTLFALVLAIGIVVDDAIVVLENVERIMTTEGLPPKDATAKAMSEVTSPVIAIVLVLCAVFIPVAFLGGLAGTMYRQFAVTIAVSVTISGIVALTLTPALCGIILKNSHSKPWAPFRWFNTGFEKLTNGYGAGVGFLMRHAFLSLALFAGICFGTYHLFATLPGSLVPDEDQGSNFVVGILPPASSLVRTTEAMKQVSENIRANPAVQDAVTFAGFDLLSGSQKTSAGVAFVTLKDWKERTDPAQDGRNLPGAFMGANAGVRDAMVLAFNPPPIQGLSTTGGFDLFVQDRGGGGTQQLIEATDALVAEAAKRPELAGVRTTFTASVPQYKIDVDREKAKALGVPIEQIFTTMQATFGSLYVNDFTLLGRNYQVSLQSEAQFREKPEDLKFVFVQSASGSMIPLDSLLKVTRVVGPDLIERYNAFTAAKVSGGPAPGYSSGQALAAMQEIAGALPEGYDIAWTGSAYQEIQTGGTGAIAIGFGILMVFLILAAQYERWSLPIAVILAVPFAMCGALVAIWLRGLENDVYFQIGLVTLVGLAAKNAILIVEFAVMKREEGLSAYDAALEGAKLRFRPIVMTSLAFILGVVPLAISTGAGSASRHSIGTGVIGGMLAATFIAIFFIPLFFKLLTRDKKPKADAPKPAIGHGPSDGAPQGTPSAA